MNPDLFDIIKTWAQDYQGIALDEWNGPGSYSLEIMCLNCRWTLGRVESDRYVALTYDAPLRCGGNKFTARDLYPTNPKFFDDLSKSIEHFCRRGR